MFATITTRGRFGARSRFPGPGAAPVAGPVVTLAFTLPLAGPAASDLPLDPPQGCQNSSPNVALQAALVDQAGVAVDLSESTGRLFWLLAPDGTKRPVPARFVSNGLDGLIQYVVTAEDLNQAGLWHLQAQVTFGTSVLLTRWAQFRAEENVVDA